ncbi:MAG: electron transport complex subunit RsxC [Fibrobacterota bacterium]
MRRFRGGVHPPDFKAATAHLEIERLPLPPRIYLPLEQRPGAAARARVRPGDTVRRGQKVAEAGSPDSAHLHSPVTGRVLEAGPVLVIENSGETETVRYRPVKNPFTALPETLLAAVIEAGVTGLSGSGRPVQTTLSPPKDRIVHTLIVNGCENEPYITADNRLLIEHPDKIVDGIRIIKRILGIHHARVGITANRREALEVFRHAADIDNEISVVALPDRYPQGAEHLLVQALTGTRLGPPASPLDAGCVVHNVATCAAVMEAVTLGKPCMERIITVSGQAIRTPKNLLAAMGTPLSFIAEYCGSAQGAVRVLLGGPMRGIAVTDLGQPLLKATPGILFLTDNESPATMASACIRCGACVRACPMGLRPCELLARTQRADASGFRKWRGSGCIECGCCAYACPARIPLVQTIQTGKRLNHDAV